MSVNISIAISIKCLSGIIIFSASEAMALRSYKISRIIIF